MGFLWRENEKTMFWSFQSLADKTNNEHLPKPFFWVMRKSLYYPSLFSNDKRDYKVLQGFLAFLLELA